MDNYGLERRLHTDLFTAFITVKCIFFLPFFPHFCIKKCGKCEQGASQRVTNSTRDTVIDLYNLIFIIYLDRFITIILTDFLVVTILARKPCMCVITTKSGDVELCYSEK